MRTASEQKRQPSLSEIRPIILFGQTPGERVKEIDATQRTLSRKADEFEKYGMQSLFATQEPRNQTATFRSLPEEIRQLIVDLHCAMPAMSWREIADICFIRFGRKPSHHSVKHIATSGPLSREQEKPHISRISRSMVGFPLVGMSLAACAERETAIQ